MNRLLVASVAFALLTTLGMAAAQEGSSFRMQLSAPILFSASDDPSAPPGGGAPIKR